MREIIPICALCNKNSANQTGSHIFSFFLIKRAINEKKETKRDKEIAFGISPINFIDTYFGRSIIPSKIEEVIGRGLDDEEIENNENPFTIDNLVCRVCEKRFGTVETYFKDNIYNKLITDDFKEEIDKKGAIIKICEDVDNRMVRLFIYLQIWRAAAAKYNEWKIKPQEEEGLRKILNEHLGVTQDETIKIVERSQTEYLHLPLIVTYLKTAEGKETENIILIDKSKMPYILIINDIVVQFFVKKRHVRSSINWVYGISDMIDNEKHLNYKEDVFKIGSLYDSQRKKFIENVMRSFARELIKNAMLMFRLLFQRCFGDKPTVEIENKVMNDLINDSQPLGYKYTFGHIREVFSSNILQFQEALKLRR